MPILYLQVYKLNIIIILILNYNNILRNSKLLISTDKNV